MTSNAADAPTSTDVKTLAAAVDGDTTSSIQPDANPRWNTKNLGLRLAADALAACAAASMVAPLIAIIDRGIMENASGKNSLRASITASLRNLVLRPHTIIISRPFALIFMVYGGTYLTANTLDTLTATLKNKPAVLVTAGTPKFFASSTANIGLCIVKDNAFTKLYGTGSARPVPISALTLFALRDCLTIFASFNVPPLLGPRLSASMSEDMQRSVSGQTIAQFAAPAGVQFFSTPLHLLGLDIYNRGQGVGFADRWKIIKKNWLISVAARICRIVPAFGVGGVINKNARESMMGRLV